MRVSVASVCVLLALVSVSVCAMPHDLEGSIFESPVAVAPVAGDAPQPATTKFFIHQLGINFIQNIVNAFLESDLKNLPLPDTTVPIVGGHVYLTNVVLKNVNFNAQQVGLVAPNQITIDFNNFSGELDLNWEYKGPLGIHDHGSATNSFSQTAINTLFTFSSDTQGRPALALSSLQVTIDDLDIDIHGGGGWLINFLIKLFKPLLKDIIEKKIDSVATADFNQILGNIMAKYPLAMPLTGKLNDTEILLPMVPTGTARAVATDDFSATANDPSPFSVSGSYLIASGEWAFASLVNTTADARPHDWIPDSLPTNPSGKAPMYGFGFDEYFAGSLLYSLTQNGFFDFTLDNSMIPPSSLIHLNTKLLQAEYPSLYNKYPNNNISFVVQQVGGAPPLATTSPSGTSLINTASIMLNVIDPTQPNPVVPICEMLVDYQLNLEFSFIDNETDVSFLTGNISPLTLNTTVTWSSLDPGSFASGFDTLLGGLFNVILVPILDGVLAKGLPIQTHIDVLAIQNLFISYGNHVFSVGFDFALPSQVNPQQFNEEDDIAAKEQMATLLREWMQN